MKLVAPPLNEMMEGEQQCILNYGVSPGVSSNIFDVIGIKDTSVTIYIYILIILILLNIKILK
jgi:hypothetical protein